MTRRISWFALLWLVASGCATPTAGARPGDMSVEEHLGAAAAEATQAQQEQDQFKPLTANPRRACMGNFGDAVTDLPDLLCWTSLANPTQKHLRKAEEHRRHAADHRAAATALREAEARACSGIDPDNRDISPFEHPEDLASAAPLMENGTRTSGAIVTFRPVRGLTAARLEHLVACHLARNASLGNVVPEMPDCPLVPKGADARVTSSPDGLAVTIRSNDPVIAAEILARAKRAMVPPERP